MHVPVAPPPAPPLPCLTAIAIARHPEGSPGYEQVSFRFSGAFPAYAVEYVAALRAEGSGDPVPLPGVRSILRVAFEHAQAHTPSGASCITSAPPSRTGEATITRYTKVDDFEGHLDYGLGIGTSGGGGEAHPKVRVVEVQRIDAGRREFVVAVQVDSTSWR